jgi:biotin carboxylase
MSRPLRVLLLASAQSYRSPAFLAAAERLGVEVVGGRDVPLPLLSSADGLALDYRDLPRSVAAIEAFAERRPLGAVLGVDDSATVLAAAAARALGLPGDPPDAARAARDKRVMRECFAAAGLPSPGYRVFTTADDPVRIAGEVRYPCVIKPASLGASRGVMRADDAEQLVARFERLRRLLRTERCGDLLVEDYVPGREVALEGLLGDGGLRVLALFDKPDPMEGPFFEETLLVTPSRLPEPAQRAIADTAHRAALALGLRRGPIHAELRFGEEGPQLIEVAARTIGGLCSRTLRFEGAGSLEELVLRQALGLSTAAVAPDPGASGVMMIPIPGAGLLRGVEGLEEARSSPGVEGVEITARIGYPLVPLPEGDRYLGFIFARGASPTEVESALRTAHRRLRFRIAPDLPLAAGGR